MIHTVGSPQGPASRMLRCHLSSAYSSAFRGPPAQGLLASPRVSPHPAHVLTALGPALGGWHQLPSTFLERGTHSCPPGLPISAPSPQHPQTVTGGSRPFLQGPQFSSQRGKQPPLLPPGTLAPCVLRGDHAPPLPQRLQEASLAEPTGRAADTRSQHSERPVSHAASCQGHRRVSLPFEEQERVSAALPVGSARLASHRR